MSALKQFYFCYGSNLLTSRMLVSNKDAKKCCNAKLKDWRLLFSGTSKLWEGSPANIVPCPGHSVVGVIWTITDIGVLDAQEVGYDPIQIDVQRLDTGEMVRCRSYVQTEERMSQMADGAPSLAYKNVVLAGARENGFPIEYIRQIEALPDNGRIPEAISRLVPECHGQHPDPAAS